MTFSSDSESSGEEPEEPTPQPEKDQWNHEGPDRVEAPMGDMPESTLLELASETSPLAPLMYRSQI